MKKDFVCQEDLATDIQGLDKGDRHTFPIEMM
jgi:hypothetical protein